MPNELPLNWCECCIKDIANIQTGKLDANAAVENGDYPFFTCALEPLRINTYSFEGNCIYLPGNGANVGYVGYYQGKFDAYQRTYVLDKIAINERYLYFALISNWKNYNKDKQFGVATNFIRLGNLENYPINLPPLAEQERIVEKIDALFADIDEGVENLKTAQAQIKQYRQSVLKSAFEGKLYKTTEWKKSTLEQHIQEINYGTSEKTKDFGKIPVFRMGDIQEGKLTFNNFKYLDKINDEKLILKKGDLLFNRTNSAELVGKSAVFNHEGSYSFASYIIKVRFDTSLDSNFICYYINSPKGRNWAKTQISQQVGQANINGTKLKNLPFPLPTLPEQQRIVEEIEKRFAVADELEKAVNEGLEKAEKLKQSILKKAFEGKLVAQNPNDEPASVLLARIKKETQSPAKGRKK